VNREIIIDDNVYSSLKRFWDRSEYSCVMAENLDHAYARLNMPACLHSGILQLLFGYWAITGPRGAE
jgi:hypothetical protein